MPTFACLAITFFTIVLVGGIYSIVKAIIADKKKKMNIEEIIQSLENQKEQIQNLIDALRAQLNSSTPENPPPVVP